ncbi:MAG: lamin tail domain-containing protein, partial [Anaerolineae bacterium]
MSSRFVLFLILVHISIVSAVSIVHAADDDIVLSEIMINAAVEDVGGNWGEWVEIYNKGATPVDLTDWQIEDNYYSDTVNAGDCPGGSCSIPAGGCWIITISQPELQDEFNHYTVPDHPAVDPGSTIFLGSRLGNGLANSGDRLILRNNAGEAVDCYSWDGSGICSTLVYHGSGNGIDGSLVGSDGQAVTNVQGIWFNHQINASPYDCINTAASGPTAVTLMHLGKAPRQNIWPVWAFLIAATGTIMVAASSHRR